MIPQHNIAGLISRITFIVLFQSGEASTVEGNKHTHTHRKVLNDLNVNLLPILTREIISRKCNEERGELAS